MEILVTLVLVIAASAPWTNAGSDFLACSDQYTIQSLSQTKSAASKAAEIAAWALEALQQSTSDMIVDCGCASAKQSAMFVNAIAPKLSDDVRERVLYLLNDTKDNNWDQVKASMKDALLRYDIKSGSFFDPILDRGQKAAMFLSTYALHYVDASSLDPITDTCHYSHTTNSVALGNAKRVASSLWERFLELRAQELAAGGILYVYVPSRSSYMASIQNKARDEALQELQRQDLALSDAFSRCTIPIVYLTADERLAKIDRSVWEIALTEEASVPSAAWAKFANSGDWKGFAETIVTQAKSYTEAILRHGLNTDATDKLFELMQESLENKFKQDSAISEHDALMRNGAPKFHKLVLRRLPDSLKSNN